MLRRNWAPFFAPGVWIQLLPLLVMFALLWATAWKPFDLSTNTIKFWEYLVYAWVYAVAVYLLGLVVFTKYLRAWWLAAVFAWLYFLIYVINAGFLCDTGMMLQPYFIWIAKPTTGIDSYLDYLTPRIVILVGFLLICGVAATWLIRRNRPALVAVPVQWLVLVVALCYVAPILSATGIFKPSKLAATMVHARFQGVWRLDQTFSLRELAENPVVILGRAVYVHRLKPLQPRPASGLQAVTNALETWQLPLGHRDYPPLDLKPFTHIVMLGTESLSLDLLAPYNRSLPPDLTPFYASLSNHMFLDYQCVAAPTQPGLAATFNSDPNTGGVLMGDCEESLIKYLDAAGYDTYFLMSWPETFLNDDVVFKKMGFKHVIGSQTWLKDPKLAPYVQERGLMDRKLYEVALDYLDQNRGKKIFIQVMNGDTHGPYPRTDYGALPYPPYPASLTHIADPSARAILAGIFRHDYDVGRTIQKMRQRNLLTESTLVILTADHNFPHEETLNDIPGYPPGPLSRIPLAFLSGQPLPPADLRQLHSQLDFAPTIAHLLGWPVPAGWWGESIFAPDQNAPSVSNIRRELLINPFDGGPRQVVSLDHPQNAAETELVTLFNSLYTNAPPRTAGSVNAARNASP